MISNQSTKMHSQFAKHVLSSISKTPKSVEFANKLMFCNQLFPKNVNVNKFIGNVVTEELFARLLNEISIPCTRSEFDFRICGIPYSLKSSSKVGNELIIKNHYGICKEFTSIEPTFIIVTELGQTRILYIDQELVDKIVYEKQKIKKTDSNVAITGGFINRLFKTTNCIEIPTGNIPYTKQIPTGIFLGNYVSMMFELATK
jgi:hypothetical protein